MTASTGVGRGGPRKRAGRKTPDGAAADVKVTLTVSKEVWQRWYDLGDGNVSLGARRATMGLQPISKSVQPVVRPVTPARKNPFAK